MFTTNTRESFRTPEWGRSFFRWLYEKTKMPLCPIYGGFPVKMVTHLGKPIHFNYDTVTPEEVSVFCSSIFSSALYSYDLFMLLLGRNVFL